MTTSLEGFAKQAARFAQHGVPAFAQKGTEAAALVAKRTILASYAAAGYGTMTLRNAGRRGSTVTARKMSIGYDVRTSKGGPTALVRLRGPAFPDLGSKDPNGWDIAPRGYGKAAQRNAAKRGEVLEVRKALKTPYGFRAKVHHPPLKGKHMFKKGAVLAQREAPRVYALAAAEELARTFR